MAGLLKQWPITFFSFLFFCIFYVFLLFFRIILRRWLGAKSQLLYDQEWWQYGMSTRALITQIDPKVDLIAVLVWVLCWKGKKYRSWPDPGIRFSLMPKLVLSMLHLWVLWFHRPMHPVIWTEVNICGSFQIQKLQGEIEMNWSHRMLGQQVRSVRERGASIFTRRGKNNQLG